MRILIVNDAADDVRVFNNMLAGMFVRPDLTARETAIPMRILIVDDMPDNIRILSSMLAGEGIEISSATSGQRALKIAEIYPPDLVLLDIMMPEMNGYEVCQAMKADPLLRGIPIIFISSLSDEESEIRGLELGAVDYISQPFKEAIVKLRVKTHLELKLQRGLLNNLSRLDGLTGIPNRRAFDEQLDLEWRRACRSRDALALLLVDIDDFKGYNERNGHLLGDDTLRKIGEILRETLNRAGDFIARHGGDDFAALLPATRPEELNAVASRIRHAVAKLNAQQPDSEPVSVCIGGASVSPTLETGTKILRAQAEQHLTFAKTLGKGQSSVAA